jgi:hypothetical protein
VQFGTPKHLGQVLTPFASLEREAGLSLLGCPHRPQNTIGQLSISRHAYPSARVIMNDHLRRGDRLDKNGNVPLIGRASSALGRSARTLPARLFRSGRAVLTNLGPPSRSSPMAIGTFRNCRNCAGEVPRVPRFYINYRVGGRAVLDDVGREFPDLRRLRQPRWSLLASCWLTASKPTPGHRERPSQSRMNTVKCV